MSRLVAFAGVVLFASTSRAVDVPLAENAALHYWQAIAALPDPEKYPEEQKKRLDDWQTCPLDEHARAVVKSHATTLLQLHRGAALPNCAWGLNNDHPRDGVGALVPHTVKSWQLVHAALLRARVRFADGDPLKATDDVCAVLRFARHLTVTGEMVSYVIHYSHERRALAVLADNIWSISENNVIRAVAAKLDKVPKPRPLIDVLRQNRDATVQWLKHQATIDKNNLPDDEKEPAGPLLTIGFWLGLETYEQSVNSFARRFTTHYDRAVAMAGLPPGEVMKASAAFDQDLKNIKVDPNNPDPNAIDEQIVRVFVGLMLPAVGKLRHTECELQAKRTMLRAALAVAAEGRDKLKVHPDPFGEGPFATKPVDGGYELTSSLGKVIDRPVTLTVRTAKPK